MKQKTFLRAAIPVLLLLIIFLIPAAFAQEPEIDPATEENECGLFNLGSCISEKLYGYTLEIINAPITPLLSMVKSLLTAEPGVGLFNHVWSIVRYILSFFYIFFFLYAAYIFLTAYDNPVKRANAKELLKNALIMIVLIQSSFFLYETIVNLGNAMSSGLLSMVDPEFFLITIDNPVNIGLQFVFGMTYSLVLLFTILSLTVRYIIVSVGVVFFPVGIFLYTIPPLRSHGKFILNLLGLFIFITFFDMLIILACSKLIDASLFASFKVLVVIVCFAMVNYTIWLVIKFALNNMISSDIKDNLKQAAKYAAMLAG
jgi:hypothetical protein